MSKAILRKELAAMEAEQLRQLVFDIYSACPDAHRYLEFFLDPNVEKLTGEFTEAIGKEFCRVKRYTSKARFSVVNKLVKTYISYGVDATDALNLMMYVVKLAVRIENAYYVNDSYYNGTRRFVATVLKYADANMCVQEIMERFGQVSKWEIITTKMRNAISEGVEDGTAQLNKKLRANKQK